MASNKLSSERAAALAAVRESEDAAFAHAVAAERAAEVAEGRRDDAVRLAEAAGEGRGRAYAHAGYVTVLLFPIIPYYSLLLNAALFSLVHNIF